MLSIKTNITSKSEKNPPSHDVNLFYYFIERVTGNPNKSKL